MLSNDRQTNKEFVEIGSEEFLFSRNEPLRRLLVVLFESVDEDVLLSSKSRTQREKNPCFNINPSTFFHASE